MNNYIPEKGDLIILTFDPQSGHEQRGRRPALVISKYLFNKHTGLCFVCPITNTKRDYPFHISIPSNDSITGFIMVEQIKSIDYQSRKAKQVGKIPLIVLNEVLSILDAITAD